MRAAPRLLGLDGLAVTRVELDAGGVRVVHVGDRRSVGAGCRGCGVVAARVKERVVVGHDQAQA